MATVRTGIVNPALREIGVVAGGETPTYDEANDAFEALNRLVDQFAAERLMIFAITRAEFTINANVGAYRFGSPAATTSGTAYSASYTDGFDTTWTGAPPEWTATTTGTGTVTNETTTTQAGGHAVKLTVPGLGLSQIVRDYQVVAGAATTLTCYMTDLGVAATGAILRVQCVETSHYLTSAGAWQAASADTLTSTDATYTAKSVTFTTEVASVVGGTIATLRITLYADSFTLGPAYFDTFSITQTATDVIMPSVPGIAVPAPPSISDVRLLDTAASPDIETPLTMLTDAAWRRVAQKDQTATRPTSWYYDRMLPDATVDREASRRFPFAVLRLHPIPTGSNLKGVIYFPTQIPQFGTLDTLVALPPGWEEMLMSNLAVRIAPMFGRRAAPELVAAARASKAIVKRSNTRLSDMGFEAGALIGNSGGGYDIRTDQ